MKGLTLQNKMYLGLGGAYCDLCHLSKNLCTTREQIENGFTITRDVADLHHIFDELVQEDGVILKTHWRV